MGINREDQTMRKSIIILSALAGIFSCTRTATPEEPVPEGYSKVYFHASMDEDSRAELAGLSVHWQGNETIRIWYKDAGGDVQRVLASIDSYSGKNAYLHAILPDDAPKDELIADINAWSNESGKTPFGTSTGRARFETPTTQNAVTGSFDPGVFAMGARWIQAGGDDEPFFQFKNLAHLLKVSVANNTGRTLRRVVFNSDTDLTGMTYWSIEDNGTVSTSGSTTSGGEITLKGSDISDGDYYFVVFPRSVTITNPSVTFHFDEGYLRSYSNTTPLSLTGSGGEVSALGSFSINAATRDESLYAPFGTSWSADIIRQWQTAGFTQNVFYDAQATTNPSPTTHTPTAFVKTDGNIDVNNSYIQGVFTFEFYAAEAGTGTLSFFARASNNQINKYIEVRLNGTRMGDRINAGTRTDISRTFAVEKGDLIQIVHCGGSSYGRLWPPISWTAAE